MIQAIAVDDEMNALGIIKEFSQRISNLELLQTFTDPTKALQFIAVTKKPIDLIFLDIQMSRLNGLTLASHLPPTCRIIITTAYPDYALQGYELDVIDYLLKPFYFSRFERAIQKAKSILAVTSKTINDEQQKLAPGTDDFIFVRTDHKVIKVTISEIQYIEGSGNYITLHLLKGKLLVLQNLKNFEEQLQPYQFVRIHRSFIISLKHIESLEKGWVMINGHEIPIGDSYRESFQYFLNKNYKQF